MNRYLVSILTICFLLIGGSMAYSYYQTSRFIDLLPVDKLEGITVWEPTENGSQSMAILRTEDPAFAAVVESIRTWEVKKVWSGWMQNNDLHQIDFIIEGQSSYLETVNLYINNSGYLVLGEGQVYKLVGGASMEEVLKVASSAQ